jgi:hypothetical protein
LKKNGTGSILPISYKFMSIEVGDERLSKGHEGPFGQESNKNSQNASAQDDVCL